jgi:ubiquinone/menaquinone biosynthesis C-methylase UbiE
MILPRLLDWSLSDATLARYRQALLAEVQGEVLEIGFGTGLNLAYYPERVTKITVIDSNPGMNALAEKRIRNSDKAVENYVLNGERLSMADNTFDSVVSTWTLCSIANVAQALKEIYRVLKPGGRFFFIEHGLSQNPKVQIWQHRLTPVQKVIADGCHLDRNIENIVRHQFNQVEIKQFTPEGMPELMSYLYQGIATKPMV